ncbi:hypothetical protein TruAng_012283 [Truncatella angustata]|nr:hypothetical protein TruAng_012283 [Truncatella angustata]
MYLRALRGKEKACGPDHTSTLSTVNNLGLLYKDQGKRVEAEDMYLRALRGFEKAWGPDHTSTLETVNNLGLLYKDQGKRVEAEDMYLRALQGYEKALGSQNFRRYRPAINTTCGLGALSWDQGKLAEARIYYQRAYDDLQALLGPLHRDVQSLHHVLLDFDDNIPGLITPKQAQKKRRRDIFKRALRISLS